MNTAVIPFTFEGENFRVVSIDGEPWFVAADVARVLGYSMAPHMMRMLDDDERGIHFVDTPSGQQEMNIISESGLWISIIKSRRPDAKKIRKWITAEVLPSIRKTGRYEAPWVQPPPQMELGADPARIAAEVSMVREGRRLFGVKAARQMWIDRGLPAPIADAVISIGEHPIYPLVRDYLADKRFVTTTEVTEAVGLNPDALMDRRTVTSAIKFAGFADDRQRVDGVVKAGWGRRSVEG